MIEQGGGGDFNLKQSRFRLAFRDKIFTVRLVRHYNISRGGLDASSLGVIKARLDGALNKVVQI